MIRNSNPHISGGVRQRDILVQWPQVVIGTAPRITEITKATTPAYLVDFTILINKTKIKLRNIQSYFFYVHKDEIKRIMRKHRKAEIDCMAPCYDYSFDNKKCNEGIKLYVYLKK